MFDCAPTPLPGLMLLTARRSSDARGVFVKTFHAGFFRSHRLADDFAESFYSISRRNVLRGLHFQAPPADHAKLVHCALGQILDVVVDLRRDSPAFGQCFDIVLDAARPQLLYIPPGFAHGFLTLSDTAMTSYAVTSTHDPARDGGILWSSIGYAWPVSAPIVSDRDASLPPLFALDSPFHGGRGH